MTLFEKLLTAINSRLPKLKNADKIAHFAGGAFVSAVGYYVLPTPGMAIVVPVVVGLLKEVYDKFHPDKHTVDVWDWVATSAGCVPVLIFHYVT